MAARPRTLVEKIWDSHVVDVEDDGTCLLYIDRHLIHEGSTPQAFDGLRAAGLPVRRLEATLGVIDHVVPTRNRAAGPADQDARGGSGVGGVWWAGLGVVTGHAA